jgi:prephenate dehydrogenase
MTDEVNSEPDFIAASRIAILGLGLMGGSLAMTLKGHCRELLGIDSNPETLKLAERIALCDRLAANPGDLLPDADIIILAAPIGVILRLIPQLPSLTSSPAVVLDLGSTKVEIVRAMAALPENFDPIGAHPMCGKERSSLVEAESGLFKGAAFALVPLPRTSQRARQIAQQLVAISGAHPVWLNEITHDRWVASTSHVPFIIANALASSTPAEVAPMIGPGYRSTTRVATSPASVMLDILMTNRENVIENISKFRHQLDHLEKLLREENCSELTAALDAGAAKQKQLLISSS